LPTPKDPDFRAQLERQRPYLLRFASLQLRSREAAEDAVQETLLAALAGESGFAGRANLRTWLTGILKHKIVDAIRRASRERPASDAGLDAEAAEVENVFDERGHWDEHPDPWEHPERALEQKQFLEALERCLEGLPERTARAFMMREHLGAGTDQICQELGITPTHCWVMLYRARMALRQCLETTWFGRQ